jgi:hypothetical protein
MPYNGSGVWSPPAADFPAVAGTLIQATKFNNVINDIATGLSTALTKDGQTTVTANLPMAGFRHTGVGNATARDQYATVDQVQDGDVLYGGTAGGTADALTITTSPTFSAYVTGMQLLFKAGASPNTGAATLQANGIAGPKAIQKDGAALAAGDIAANKWYRVIYDGTAFQLDEVLTPSSLGKSLFIAASAAAARSALSVPSNAEAVLQTLADAKGDMIGASAADTWAKLTVGANDTFLLADSAQATGLKWGTVNSFTEDTAPDKGADYVPTYDASAAVMRRVLLGRASGPSLQAVVPTTSGTSIDITGIPSWVTRITIKPLGMSMSGSSKRILQLGDSGGIENTGYTSTGGDLSGGTTTGSQTDGIELGQTTAAADALYGWYVLELADAATFTWVAFGFALRNTTNIGYGVGHKSLSAQLDRIRLTTTGGTDTFDGGSVVLMFE